MSLRGWMVAMAGAGLSVGAVAGCAGRPALFKNPDPSLRKTSAQLAADAAKRSYHADAPRAVEQRARAQAAYGLKRLEVVNFSGEEWTDVEVWVNRRYVCFVPVMEDRKIKEIQFPMLYDDSGNYFPLDNRKEMVKSVELLRDGKMYEIVVKPAE